MGLAGLLCVSGLADPVLDGFLVVQWDGRLTFAQQAMGLDPAFAEQGDPAVAHADIQFIAVGTPRDEDGSADLQYVLAVARTIGEHMTSDKIVVTKSTVPVGTGDKVQAAIAAVLKERNATHGYDVVSNPEFLKEGAAVEDFMKPDRIIVGG